MIILIGALFLLGCQNSETVPEVEEIEKVVEQKGPSLKTHQVIVLGKKGFNPEMLTINQGDRIEFINYGDKEVSITIQKGKSSKFINTEIIEVDARDYVNLPETGTYEFWTIGYGVKAKIIVS